MPTQDQTIQTKQDIPKQQQKFYRQVGVESAKTYQQPDENNLVAKYGETITEKLNV